MGHGASMPASCEGLFVNQELMDGRNVLAENELLRLAFVSHIKSGAWVERLNALAPTCKIMNDNEGMLTGLELTPDMESVRKYEVPIEKVNEIATACLRGDVDSVITAPTLTPSHDRMDCFKDSYITIEDCKCFNADQMVSVLFNVLFPIFKAGSAHENAFVSGEPGSFDGTDHSKRRRVRPHSSQRIVNVLLGCAAYFDESYLLRRLQQPSWLSSVMQAVGNYALGITVSDMSATADPIVYSNRAFQFSFGYTGDEFTGMNLSMLNGPATEPAQTAIIHAAMCERKAVKVGVTHYTNSRAAVLNLVAIRAVGRYSVAVHFPVTKTARMEDLGMVDDLLVLISALLKNTEHPALTTDVVSDTVMPTQQSSPLWSKRRLGSTAPTWRSSQRSNTATLC